MPAAPARLQCPSVYPIGVFDSGIGGLSILAALLQAMPDERFVYFSDAGHAPYGERDDAFIAQRCLHIAEALLQQQGIKALVVACNTATTVAIHLLRQAHPQLPIIGVEPALKPALEQHPQGHVAVLATDRTLASAKYQALAQRMALAYPQARISALACSGLAGAIEADAQVQIDALCAHYTAQACALGARTLVLGCTHYPLVLDRMQAYAPQVQFVHSAPAVARHTRQRLLEADLLAPARPAAPEGQKHALLDVLSGALPAPARLQLTGSGDAQLLHAKAGQYLARCVAL